MSSTPTADHALLSDRHSGSLVVNAAWAIAEAARRALVR